MDLRPRAATTQTPAVWRVLHVIYSSKAARLCLVADEIPRLVANAGTPHWYFVDVPLRLSAFAGPGLEIAFRHGSGRTEQAATAGAWLEEQEFKRTVVAGAYESESLVLRPELYFGGKVPASLGEALTIGTARAIPILTRASPAQPVHGYMLRKEIAATFAALIPSTRERLAALELQIAWLKALASQQASPPGATRSSNQRRHRETEAHSRQSHRDWAHPIERTDYESVRCKLRQQSDFISAGASFDTAVCWASIVARLAHIQIVRLRGPGDPRALDKEAALLREIRGALSRDLATDA